MDGNFSMVKPLSGEHPRDWQKKYLEVSTVQRFKWLKIHQSVLILGVHYTEESTIERCLLWDVPLYSISIHERLRILKVNVSSCDK